MWLRPELRSGNHQAKLDNNIKKYIRGKQKWQKKK